jgi:hypothetical protein
MMDPLQYATIEEPLQMGLEECLFLMHRHRQHLEKYRDYFSRLKEHLNLHVLMTCRRLRLQHSDGCGCKEKEEEEEEKREIRHQIHLLGEQQSQVTDLQQQVASHVSALDELFHYLSSSVL